MTNLHVYFRFLFFLMWLHFCYVTPRCTLPRNELQIVITLLSGSFPSEGC